MADLLQSCGDLLARMVGFDTVVAYHSGRPDPERELASFLAEIASEWGLVVRELPIEGACHNLLIEHRISDDAPWLLFDSHMDTVGVEGMTIDPFAAEVRDGRMFGRGTCDTKGTGAAMLWALRKYANSNQQPNNVAILFTVGEEHVQLGARMFVEHHLELLDWRPGCIVAGEPTQMDVLAATGGFVRWQISTRGRACHSSRPERGHNAIYDMAHVITAIEEKYVAQVSAEDSIVGKASAAITVVRGGEQVNVIPERATMTFDRRLVPGEMADDEVERVRQVVNGACEAHPDMNVNHHDFESAPPMVAIDGGVRAKQTTVVLKEVDIESRVRGELFTTNGNHFSKSGIPTIVVGPGDIAQAHMPDESISLDELDLGVKGYLAIMQHAT